MNVYIFKPKSQKIHIKILNKLIAKLSLREKGLTPVRFWVKNFFSKFSFWIFGLKTSKSLTSTLFTNDEKPDIDSKQYWDAFILQTCQKASNDLETHSKVRNSKVHHFSIVIAFSKKSKYKVPYSAWNRKMANKGLWKRHLFGSKF